MRAKGLTIRKAAEMWVLEMNAISRGMIEKLTGLDPCDWHEVTVPVKGDSVYVYDTDREGHFGFIRSYDPNTDRYTVFLGEVDINVSEEDFEVVRSSELPSWGTMWSFGDSCDDRWLANEDGIRAMSECGFRIYESEEFGYFFGIDGAGYDFFSEHWVPLYKARGVHWHDPETEKEAS